jgi:hypothetical protein
MHVGTPPFLVLVGQPNILVTLPIKPLPLLHTTPTGVVFIARAITNVGDRTFKLVVIIIIVVAHSEPFVVGWKPNTSKGVLHQK